MLTGLQPDAIILTIASFYIPVNRLAHLYISYEFKWDFVGDYVINNQKLT